MDDLQDCLSAGDDHVFGEELMIHRQPDAVSQRVVLVPLRLGEVAALPGDGDEVGHINVDLKTMNIAADTGQ